MLVEYVPGTCVDTEDDLAAAERVHPVAATPERLWQTWTVLDALAPCPLEDVESVLVLGAHRGDETLGVGGTLALLAAAGTRLRVVTAADGENPDAFDRLGIGARHVRRLGLPAGRLADNEDELTEITGRMMRGFDLCLAPWTGEAHPDHGAAGRAAAAAGAAAGIRVFHYPIFMWRWAEPADTRVPWHLAERIELPAWAMAAKHDAVALRDNRLVSAGRRVHEHVLPTEELGYFRRAYEVVFA